MNPCLLRVQDLRVKYRNTGLEALRSVSFELAAGTLAVIMGPAGAGKSTLCHTLNGLVPHFLKAELEGHIFIGDDEVTTWPVARRAQRLGLVLQDFETQLFSTRVDLSVAFFPENLAVPRDELAQRVHAALAAVQLNGFEARDPLRLSGGQKQRVVIASVLAAHPPVLVLDEPLSDLDPMGRREVLAALRGLRDTGATVLMVENDGDALLGADRVGIMREGALSAWGAASDVLRDNALLRAAGLRPQPLCELFERVGLPQRPLAVEEAVDAWRERDFEPAVWVPSSPPPYPFALEAVDVHFGYDAGPEVLRGVSFGVPRNEIVALLGQNGSGKSTLAQHFNGLLAPRSGQVFIDGRPLGELTGLALAQTVGFIFQNPDHQIFAETVIEEVSFAPRQLGLPAHEVETRVAEALHAVQLVGRETDDPFSMSRGERQRVAVASVLAARPRILIFDEPTTGLDAAQVDEMMRLIERLRGEGRTVLIITHALDVAARHCRWTAVMQDGRIAMMGPTAAVLAQTDALSRAGLIAPMLARFAQALALPFVNLDTFAQACTP